MRADARYDWNEEPSWRWQWSDTKLGVLQARAYRVWVTTVPAVMIAVGICLRLRQYLYRRSLWNDEAALAKNILERGYFDLLRPLDFHQGAPIGFLWSTKAAVSVFGDNEYALRLVPLVAGIVSLFLSARVARHFVSSAAVPLALAMFASLRSLVYFSTETKQYAVDVAAVLLIIDVTLRTLDRPLTRRRTLVWAACCGGALWFSHPAVFAAGGAVTIVCVRVLVSGDRRERALALAAVAAITVSLGAVYLVSLRLLGRDPLLLEYWEFGLPPAQGGLARRLAWLPKAVAHLVPDPLAVTPPGLFAALLVVGTGALAVRRSRALLLLIAILSVVGLATLARRYPLALRLALFVVPVAIVVAVAAADAPLRLRRRVTRVGGRAVMLVAVAVVVGGTLVNALGAVRRPYTVSEIRPVLEGVADDREPGDVLLSHWTAAFLTDYYAPRLGLRRDGYIAFDGSTACPPGGGAASLRNKRRVWVVYAYPPGYLPADNAAAARAQLDSVGRRVRRLAADGAEADLYEMGAAPRE